MISSNILCVYAYFYFSKCNIDHVLPLLICSLSNFLVTEKTNHTTAHITYIHTYMLAHTHTIKVC